MLCLNKNFKTRYLLSSCSNHIMTKISLQYAEAWKCCYISTQIEKNIVKACLIPSLHVFYCSHISVFKHFSFHRIQNLRKNEGSFKAHQLFFVQYLETGARFTKLLGHICKLNFRPKYLYIFKTKRVVIPISLKIDVIYIEKNNSMLNWFDSNAS